MPRQLAKHLEAEDISAFVLDDLSADEAAEIDHHLEACVACTQLLEGFDAAQHPFPAQRWIDEKADFVSSLRQKICGVSTAKTTLSSVNNLYQRLIAFLQSPIAGLSLEVATTSAFDGGLFNGGIKEVDSEDGLFTLTMRAEGENIELSIESFSMELVGKQITICFGKKEQTTSFQKIDDMVMAKLQIPLAELKDLPPGTATRVK